MTLFAQMMQQRLMSMEWSLVVGSGRRTGYFSFVLMVAFLKLPAHLMMFSLSIKSRNFRMSTSGFFLFCFRFLNISKNALCHAALIQITFAYANDLIFGSLKGLCAPATRRTKICTKYAKIRIRRIYELKCHSLRR